ncbi:MAG TPA: VWA domain-containing protein [Pyrinomonadaceae bacterium]|jgi:VWFA-related protein
MLKRNAFLSLFTAVFIAAGLFVLAPARAQVTSAPAATPTPTPDPDDEVIKIESDVVNVLFTAQDKNRRLLTDLKDSDVSIFEDGKQQEITAFSRQIDLPMSMSILIDVSLSQTRTLPEEKTAAVEFLESVMRPAKDEVSVVSFTGESTLEQGMTNNLPRLRRAINDIRIVPPSGWIGGNVGVGTPPISGRNADVQGSTAIWDAVWVTGEEVLGPAPEHTRRAIILLTDGVSNFGKKKLDDAVDAALRSEAIIYAIGIGDNYYSGVDKATLNKLTDRTGGRAYFPRDERDLRDAFAQIQDEMRSQYLISYEPTNQAKDGSYRRIEVQLANPGYQKDKVKLNYRQGYFSKTKK